MLHQFYTLHNNTVSIYALTKETIIYEICFPTLDLGKIKFKIHKIFISMYDGIIDEI